MPRFVVAYPALSEADRTWIQAYRREHQAFYFNLIGPHFTFLIAPEAADDLLIEEMAAQLEGAGAIDFELTFATVAAGDAAFAFHEYLIPERGYGAMTLLRERMFRGGLRQHRTYDQPFVPHLSVGGAATAAEAQGRVDVLNTAGVSICGKIEAIEVAEARDGAIVSLARLSLA